MTDAPKVPSEDDFLKISSPRDFVDEALADGLIPDGDTRSMFERTYVPVAKRPEVAKQWVDDSIIALRLMCFAAEIDGWEHTNEDRLDKLFENFPDEHERLCEEMWAARENVKQLRW